MKTNPNAKLEWRQVRTFRTAIKRRGHRSVMDVARTHGLGHLSESTIYRIARGRSWTTTQTENRNGK